MKITLETSGEDGKITLEMSVLSVLNMISEYETPHEIATQNEGKHHTQNEWRRWKTTLETSEEDVKLHSKRVKKM